MAREISAGGVVVKREGGRWWLAAIEPQNTVSRHGREPRSRAVLALPKGLVDAGESPEQTAVREVREETGLEAKLVTKLDDIRYMYVRSWGDRQRVFKIVSFYLLLRCGGKLGDIKPEMRKEVRGAHWLPLEEAEGRLTYRGERLVVRLAQDYLEKHKLSMEADAGG